MPEVTTSYQCATVDEIQNSQSVNVTFKTPKGSVLHFVIVAVGMTS